MEQENRKTKILENRKSSTQLNRGKIKFFSMLTIIFIFTYTCSRSKNKKKSKISSSHDDMKRIEIEEKFYPSWKFSKKHILCWTPKWKWENNHHERSKKNNINFSLEKQFFFTLSFFFSSSLNKHNKKWKEFNFFFSSIGRFV